MDQLHYQSLADTCRQLKSGERTAVSVVQHTLDRIEQLEPDLRAFASVQKNEALAQAEVLDRQRASGMPLGPLHGVPIAVKDLLDTKDVVTASGTKVMANRVPTADATVVERLRQAGAVLVGKSQLTEGAFGAHHPDIAPPRNPFHSDYWPGVSSSGSGVSVASGMAYGALGTDTGGSIRFPSACCGLVGLKPTYGRVSRHGAFALAESLDHIGPMTRRVADAARLLRVIAGHDPHDLSSLDEAVPNYEAACATELKNVRIGVDWAYVTRGVAEPVVQVVRDACRLLQDLGATVVEVQLPSSYQTLVDGWGITCGVECARAHADLYPQAKAQYGPVLSGLIELGLSVPAQQYDDLQVTRQSFKRALDDLFGAVDFLISPCMPDLVPTVQEMDAAVANDDSRAAFITFTAPFDYSGHPTLTLPAALDERGLPTSFQLVGAALSEASLLRTGTAYEAAFGAFAAPNL